MASAKWYYAEEGKPDRVWFELQRPPRNMTTDERDAYAKSICDKFNRMMSRMCGEDQHTTVFWHSDKQTYCFGDIGGFVEASDNGHWFNLDYLGRA